MGGITGEPNIEPTTSPRSDVAAQHGDGEDQDTQTDKSDPEDMAQNQL